MNDLESLSAFFEAGLKQSERLNEGNLRRAGLFPQPVLLFVSGPASRPPKKIRRGRRHLATPAVRIRYFVRCALGLAAYNNPCDGQQGIPTLSLKACNLTG